MKLTPEQLAAVAKINFGDAMAQSTVKKLLAHIDSQQTRITELENAICNSLGGVHYLDMPDGGSVAILDQLDAWRRTRRGIVTFSMGALCFCQMEQSAKINSN